MKHKYEQTVIEGTRLLGIKDDKRSGSYGSYVRIVDTGKPATLVPMVNFLIMRKRRKKSMRLRVRC